MSYSSEVLADSPAAWWRLNEASGYAADSTSNGRALAPVGSLTYGSAALFTGGGTCVTFPNSATAANQFNTAGASWQSPSTISVEAWCSPAAITGGQEILLRDYGGGASQGSWRLRLNAGQLQLLVWTASGAVTTLTGATVLTAGAVYHLVGTFDGTTLKVYVNGALDGSMALSGSVYDPTFAQSDLRIGQLGDNTEPFNGRIGHCAVYSGALSAARIAAHYAAAGASYATTVLADSPLAYWKLDDAAVASTFADSSGNARSLTRSGVFTSTSGAVGDGDKATVWSGGGGGYAASPAWPRAAVFSVECWAKWTPAAQMEFVCLDNSHIAPTDSARVFQFRSTTAGAVQFECYSTGGSVLDVNSVAVLNDGNWHHLVAVVNGAAVTLYIDGASSASGTISGTINAGTTTTNPNWFSIAADNSGSPVNDLLLTGSLDEVAFYPTALSAARVSAHYSAAKAGTETGVAAMSAQSGMGVAGIITEAPAVAMSAQSGMGVAGTVTPLDSGAVAMSAQATMATAPVTPTESGVVAISCYGQLVVSGADTPSGAVPMSAYAALGTAPSDTLAGAAALSAWAAMAVSVTSTRAGTVSLSAYASLTVAGSLKPPDSGAAVLSAYAGLAVSATGGEVASPAMSALASMAPLVVVVVKPAGISRYAALDQLDSDASVLLKAASGYVALDVIESDATVTLGTLSPLYAALDQLQCDSAVFVGVYGSLAATLDPIASDGTATFTYRAGTADYTAGLDIPGVLGHNDAIAVAVTATGRLALLAPAVEVLA